MRVVYLGHTASLSGGEIAIANLLGALDGVDAHVLLAEDGPMVDRFRAVGARGRGRAPWPSGRARCTATRSSGSARFGPAIDAVRYAARLGPPHPARCAPDLVHTISLEERAVRRIGRPARAGAGGVVDPGPHRAGLPARPGRADGADRVARAADRRSSPTPRRPQPPCPKGRARIDVVHPAVPVLPAAPARSGAPYRVGVVGRLRDWKGQHVFLDAFAKAFAGSDAEARLIGAPLFGEEALRGRAARGRSTGSASPTGSTSAATATTSRPSSPSSTWWSTARPSPSRSVRSWSRRWASAAR